MTERMNRALVEWRQRRWLPLWRRPQRRRPLDASAVAHQIPYCRQRQSCCHHMKRPFPARLRYSRTTAIWWQYLTECQNWLFGNLKLSIYAKQSGWWMVGKMTFFHTIWEFKVSKLSQNLSYTTPSYTHFFILLSNYWVLSFHHVLSFDNGYVVNKSGNVHKFIK